MREHFFFDLEERETEKLEERQIKASSIFVIKIIETNSIFVFKIKFV